jgi:hypothetical protein
MDLYDAIDIIDEYRAAYPDDLSFVLVDNAPEKEQIRVAKLMKAVLDGDSEPLNNTTAFNVPYNALY